MDLPETVRVEREGDVTSIFISGNITGDRDFSFVDRIESGRVKLDLLSTGRITSSGVVLWLEMMLKLCEKATVEIQNATHGFLYQYAMVSGFAGNGRIESLLITYDCEGCGAQRSVELRRKRDFPDGILAPAEVPTCARCAREMVTDDLLFELVRF